jgi:Fe-S oxidoreductase
MSKVGLFIPCYVDQLYPQVGLATLRVLRRLGVDVDFPEEQTCCGQPMANSGCAEYTRPLAERFLKIFGKYDHVVAPSGSCVSMVRNHYAQWLEGKPDFDHDQCRDSQRKSQHDPAKSTVPSSVSPATLQLPHIPRTCLDMQYLH